MPPLHLAALTECPKTRPGCPQALRQTDPSTASASPQIRVRSSTPKQRSTGSESGAEEPPPPRLDKDRCCVWLPFPLPLRPKSAASSWIARCERCGIRGDESRYSAASQAVSFGYFSLFFLRYLSA